MQFDRGMSIKPIFARQRHGWLGAKFGERIEPRAATAAQDQGQGSVHEAFLSRRRERRRNAEGSTVSESNPKNASRKGRFPAFIGIAGNQAVEKWDWLRTGGRCSGVNGYGKVPVPILQLAARRPRA